MAEYKSSVLKYGAIALILGLLVIGLSVYSSSIVSQNLHLTTATSQPTTSISTLQSSSSSIDSSLSHSTVSSASSLSSSSVSSSAITSTQTSSSSTSASESPQTSSTYTTSSSQTTTSSSTPASSATSISTMSSTSSSSSSSTTTTKTTSSSTTLPPVNTIATIPVQAQSSSSIAFNPTSKMIYVSTSNRSIAVIDGSTNKISINYTFSCGSPSNLAFDTKDQILYSVFQDQNPDNCQGGGSVDTLVGINVTSDTIISGSSNIGTIWGVAYDQQANLLIVEASNSTVPAFLALLNASNETREGTIALQAGFSGVGGPAFGPIVYDSTNGLAYVVWGIAGATNLNYAASIVNVTSKSIVGSFNPEAGDEPPSQLAINSNNGDVYVSESGVGNCIGYNDCPFLAGQNITVLSGNITSNSYNINPGNNESSLGAIAYDGSSNAIFVANGTAGVAGLDNISIVNAATGKVSGVLGVNSAIQNLFVDPAATGATSWLYVATSSGLYVVAVND